MLYDIIVYSQQNLDCGEYGSTDDVVSATATKKTERKKEMEKL